MKILVTGGAGFIGSHTIVELHQAGLEPIIVDDFSNSSRSVLEGLRNILGYEVICYAEDCNRPESLRRVFGEHDIAGVIHFAASKAVGESVQQPLKYYRNNLGSLFTLLTVMLEQQRTHLVFSSSCTVYGQPKELPVNENSPILPAESPYGNTKQICEEIIRDTTKSGVPLKALSLRYFNPIGAHPSAQIGELPIGTPGNLVPFITQTAAGLRGQMTVFGDDYPTPDGTCVRDYIHVVDLAKAHVKALQLLFGQAAANHYDVFNIGTGRGASVLEVIRTFEEVTGTQVDYRIGERRAGDIEQIYAEVNKATEGLHWRAEKPLREALADAWRWQQKLMRKGG
ncbi:MAG: UDP-glucose 4-epimerase GalE [Ferruginibacter sp.]|nr:UDP-glucose 4-epimerase GalE [Cytophagales bacterium]